MSLYWLRNLLLIEQAQHAVDVGLVEAKVVDVVRGRAQHPIERVHHTPEEDPDVAVLNEVELVAKAVGSHPNTLRPMIFLHHQLLHGRPNSSKLALTTAYVTW
eukprot:3909323-Pyramimonas_sp.AAC.2